MPGNAPLAAEPTMEKVKEASGKLAHGEAAGTDNLSGELFKLSLTEGSPTLKCLHDLLLTVWCQEVVPQERDPAIGGRVFDSTKTWPQFRRPITLALRLYLG